LEFTASPLKVDVGKRGDLTVTEWGGVETHDSTQEEFAQQMMERMRRVGISERWYLIRANSGRRLSTSSGR